jgi:uncharacterized membrane protein
MQKFWGLFTLPLISLLVGILLLLIPLIDPLKENIRQFRAQFETFVLLVLAFLFGVHLVVVLWSAGIQISLNIVMPIGAGLLFFAVAGLLPHTKRNWFIGIRTPWTLSSDLVWERTHRLGAKLFRGAGLIALIGALFDSWAFAFIMVPVMGATLWTIGYSYFAYRALESART